ncbi:hypothetical protein AAF712_014957 [Marasmius tenuissimus]|uniref:Uncharacterized protein n=1 Tax=Marasmius tenuissimus TaxID=585030 RepID=A0ABR2ZD27_9AGAR
MDLLVLGQLYRILGLSSFRIWGLAITSCVCRLYYAEVDQDGRMTIRTDYRCSQIVPATAYGWLQLYEIIGRIAKDAEYGLIERFKNL